MPENLTTAVLTNEDFGPDLLQEMTLTAEGNALAERLLRLPRRRLGTTGVSAVAWAGFASRALSG